MFSSFQDFGFFGFLIVERQYHHHYYYTCNIVTIVGQFTLTEILSVCTFQGRHYGTLAPLTRAEDMKVCFNFYVFLYQDIFVYFKYKLNIMCTHGCLTACLKKIV